MTEQPIFSSTHAALSFAFGYSERAGRPNMLGVLSSKELPRSGRGLGGIDGAAQSGMIRREIEDLKPLQRAVVICKFSHPSRCPHCHSFMDSNERKEAIEALAQHTLEVLKGERPNLALRRGIVRAQFGERVKFADLARTCGVSQNTVTNHSKKVREALSQLEKAAFARLDEALAPMVGESLTTTL